MSRSGEYVPFCELTYVLLKFWGLLSCPFVTEGTLSSNKKNCTWKNLADMLVRVDKHQKNLTTPSNLYLVLSLEKYISCLGTPSDSHLIFSISYTTRAMCYL